MQYDSNRFGLDGKNGIWFRRHILVLVPVFFISTLACSFQGVFSSSPDLSGNILELPTLTSTMVVATLVGEETNENTETPAAIAEVTIILPTSTPWPSATPQPKPIGTPSPTITRTPTPDGFYLAPVSLSSSGDGGNWSLVDVAVYPNQSENTLHLYGNLVNNTNVSYELSLITGTFFDSTGQIIAGTEDVVDFWPSDIVPSDGRMPFGLIVEDIQSAANFELAVETQSINETLFQDFEFQNQYQQADEDSYCVGGTAQNPSGNLLQNYLLIMAILYDAQGHVVGFGDYYESTPDFLIGDQTLDFEICVGQPNQEVASFELQAWGQ